MKKSVMTAGEIYEEVYKLREEIRELEDALCLIGDKIGDDNAAYKLTDKHKSEKFNELREFEKRVFTQQAQPLDTFWADKTTIRGEQYENSIRSTR